MAPDKLHTSILDNLQTAILLVDPDLSISYINSAAEALLKSSGNRLIGTAIDSLFAEGPGSTSSLNDAINTLSSFTQRETRLRMPGGQSITVDCGVTPIIEKDIVKALVIELQPLDRLLRISREEGLLTSQQNSHALIRGLAHEIKNPLGGLRGAAQLLARELPDAALSDYTQIIIEEADRLGKLVDRLLGSHNLLEIKPLNIHQVVERVRTLIDAEADGRIAITRDYDPSIPELEGDQERLIQAVLNIARNAMQALLSYQADVNGQHASQIIFKTRTLRQFTIGTQSHRLVCKVTISNNGPVIPAELMDTLFLPMVSGRAEGTGLGLSISQSIINHHKGLIECKSEAEQTHFSLYIPLTTESKKTQSSKNVEHAL